MRAGRFHDFWRGDGWFVSIDVRGGWLLFAFRPKCWRMRVAQPRVKPGVTRLYIGPFEIELTQKATIESAEKGPNNG